MSGLYGNAELDALRRIHHRIYYKTLHSNFEDNFPMIRGVTSLEMGVLGVLSDCPGAMLREISEKLAVPKSTLTSVIDRLERRGYVNRAISKRDRRSFELVLTDDGKAAQQQHIACEQAVYEKVAGSFDSKEEVLKFIALLDKIAERL